MLCCYIAISLCCYIAILFILLYRYIVATASASTSAIATAFIIAIAMTLATADAVAIGIASAIDMMIAFATAIDMIFAIDIVILPYAIVCYGSRCRQQQRLRDKDCVKHCLGSTRRYHCCIFNTL